MAVEATSLSSGEKPAITGVPTATQEPPSTEATPSRSCGKPALPPFRPGNIVALDCEMVGCGKMGRKSALARCSVVDYTGKILYDGYVRPIQPITDYRTKWSGIRPKHMSSATPMIEARKLILKHLRGKYLVGHDLKNDFQALNFKPHPALVKDTSKCVALRHLAGLDAKRKPSLRLLTRLIRGKDIQSASHCSVEDARAAMALFKAVEDKWEDQTNPFLDDSYWAHLTT